MKPGPFAYSAPTSVGETLQVLADLGPDGKVLAGGQSLIPILSMRLATFPHLVDINRVSELDTIEPLTSNGHGVRVGALARHSHVERSPVTALACPALVQALRFVAHPAVKNRGTVCGALAHADPSSELPAMLALLGGSVEVAQAGQPARLVPAAEFFLGPLESALGPGDLVIAARFPAVGGRSGTGFLEVSRRRGDYALCGVGAAVTLDDDLRIVSARAAYVSVSPTPLVLDLTDAVAGRPASTADYAAAGRQARSAVSPEADIHASAEYRRELAMVLTERVLAAAARRAGAPDQGGVTA
jgi:aerobic carbon-monoxide dehydrogenase medium subunit